MALTPLLQPVQIGSLTLPNRIVMAPMTRNKSPLHVPTDQVAAYYRRRVEGGVGLIHNGRNGSRSRGLQLLSSSSCVSWAASSRRMETRGLGNSRGGGKVFPQLWHVGSVRQLSKHCCDSADNPSHCTECDCPGVPGFAPSSVRHPSVENAEVPHEMTVEEIRKVVDAFARSAFYAKELGFDSIELHGAHGYLIDQFFWEETKYRTDEYGGETLAERTRFAVEVVKATRGAVGPDFLIDLRISQWKMGNYTVRMAHTPQELEAFLLPLVEAGVDLWSATQKLAHCFALADTAAL